MTKQARNPKRIKDPSRKALPAKANWIQRCEYHDRRLYITRAEARKVAKLHQPAKNVYRCTQFPALWHVGSLAAIIKAGVIDRRTLYQDTV